MRFPGQIELFRSPDDGAGSAPSASSPASSAPSSGGGNAGGGGDSTPSSSSPADTSTDTNDFADFDPYADMDEVDVPEPAAKPGSDVPPTAGDASVPKAPVVPPPGGVSEPKAAEVSPPVPVAQVPAPASSAPMSEIDGIVAGLDQERPALQKWLSENVYALSKEEKDSLETEAITVLPRLLARVHMEISKSVLQQIQNFVPKMAQEAIGKFKASTDKRNEALGAFYKANPSLKAGDHDAVVDQYARMFRANNPRASREEAFKFVGAAVAAHFGISLGAAPVPVAPKGNGSTPPFQPARPGARQVAQTPVGGQEWSGLGQDFDDS